MTLGYGNPPSYNYDKVVLTDLDSTLANVHHREHLAPVGAAKKDGSNWIAYSKGCVNDEVVNSVATALRMYHQAGYRIHVVSGRNVEAYGETVQWLKANGIYVDEIRLRGENDFRHNAEFKSHYINGLKDLGLEPVLMFEDHVSVCEIIEERTGVPCITVRPRYEDGVGVSFNLDQHPEIAE